MENSRQILSNNIEYYLRKNHMQQKDLADRMGVNKSMISGYINLGRNPGFDKIDLIAQAFGISVSDLFVNHYAEYGLTKEEKRFQSFLNNNHDAAEIVKLLKRMTTQQLRVVRIMLQDLVDARFGENKY